MFRLDLTTWYSIEPIQAKPPCLVPAASFPGFLSTLNRLRLPQESSLRILSEPPFRSYVQSSSSKNRWNTGIVPYSARTSNNLGLKSLFRERENDTELEYPLWAKRCAARAPRTLAQGENSSSAWFALRYKRFFLGGLARMDSIGYGIYRPPG